MYTQLSTPFLHAGDSLPLHIINAKPLLVSPKLK